MAEHLMAGYLTIPQLSRRTGLSVNKLNWARLTGKLDVWRIGEPGYQATYCVDKEQWERFRKSYTPRKPYTTKRMKAAAAAQGE